MVLNDLNLRAQPGEVTLLQGKNGSGKSTLLRVLAGQLRPVQGEIRWAGRELSPSDVWFLGSQALGSGDLTLEENLEFTGLVLGLGKEAATQRCRDLIRFWDMEDHRDTLHRDLSTGLARRADLAAALVHPRPLWLLDEPLNGLDAASLDRLVSVLLQLKASGAAVILTSHVWKPFEALVDRWLSLEEGAVTGTTGGNPGEARGAAGLRDGILPWLS